MMMKYDFTLGYDLGAWQDYKIKTKITTDISSNSNSHMLFCGMSRSGKSYTVQQVLSRLARADKDSTFYFADYKRDDSFAHLRNQARYFSYKDTLKALDVVYGIMQARISGEDETRNQVTFIWDEYVANILAMYNDGKEGKKQAEIAMRKVAEILMMGASMCIRIIVSCQRPDAIVFPQGSRLNYGVVVILGGYNDSIYRMLLPDHIDKIKQRIQTRDHDFKQGEGSILLDLGSTLKFIKIGEVANMAKMKERCRLALS